MKRGRSDGGSKTGGTGDVKPQYMTMATAVAGAVDDYRIDVFQIPIVRPSSSNNAATIMEMLSIDWYLGVRDVADPTSTHFAFITPNTVRSSGDTSTIATAAEDLADPRTSAFALRQQNQTTSGSTTMNLPIHVDLTDNNGNGMLWAADTITVVKGAISDTTVSETVAKLKYRWVRVGLIEYLGIISQQQS